MWNTVISFLPELIGALLILFLGWFIAKWIGRMVTKLLNYMHVDRYSEKIGIHDDIRKIGLNMTIAQLFGLLVKWMILIAIFIAVADILNIPQFTSLLGRFLAYLPNVLVAIIILLVGLTIGRIVYNFLHSSLHAMDLPERTANLLATTAKAIVIVLAVLTALVQMQIAPVLIQILFGGLVLMLALAGGLAFGLGGREHANSLLSSIQSRFGKKTG